MNQFLKRTALTAGAAILFGLAALGAVQAAARVSSPAAAAPATLAASDSAAVNDQAATGDATLSAEFDAILAADQKVPADRIKAAALRRFGSWQRLVHATAVVDLPKQGGLTTVQLDHGKITSVNSTTLAIAEAGGTNVTVTLGGDTRVRRNATKAAVADLKIGDEVVVMSKVESGGATAYVVIVPKA